MTLPTRLSRIGSVWIVTAQPENWSSPGEFVIEAVYATEAAAESAVAAWPNGGKYPDGSSRVDIEEWDVHA